MTDADAAKVPETGEEQYLFEVEKKRKYAVPRLKIYPKRVLLMVSDAMPDADVDRYRKIAAQLFVKALERGIPGAVYGRFEYEYDGIVLTYKGKEFGRYIDKEAYQKDHPIVANDEVSMIQAPADAETLIKKPDLKQTVALNQGRSIT